MPALLECIPNFSEGQNTQTIRAIASVIESTKNVQLLDIDSGPAANRTVMTFAGEPGQVVLAAYKAIEKAAEIIDMRKHKGTHPRMGATDVCPLVPLSGMKMEEVDQLAKNLAQKVGNQLSIPVYLYEHSANTAWRKNLALIRKGEFEGLAKRMQLSDWKPDTGPSVPHPTAGATVIGARDFLVAFNVNLNTSDKEIAHKIAARVRTSGYTVVRNGEKFRRKGRLKHVKALGWYIPEFQCAQVSMNLVDFRKTSLAHTFEVVKDEATKEGVEVTGSELVGMLPLEAVLQSAAYYRPDQQGITDSEAIDIVVDKLGLNTVKPFQAKNKIIELKMQKA